MTLGRSGQQISSSCLKGVNGAVYNVVLPKHIRRGWILIFSQLKVRALHKIIVAATLQLQ
jgi:hypothetical protein